MSKNTVRAAFARNKFGPHADRLHKCSLWPYLGASAKSRARGTKNDKLGFGGTQDHR
jgi:hypothetical protein